MNKLTELAKFVFDNTLAAFIKADSVASIGRYMLTIEFFTMLFGYWFVAADPPETLLSVFFATMVYVFGDKFVAPIKEKISGAKVTTASAPPPQPTVEAQASVTKEKEPDSI